MKKIKIILTIISTILLFNSCEKDENGYRIAYFKNKTAIIMKKIIPILLFIILPIILKAQKEYTQMIDTVFQDVSRIDATTGILYDRVLPFSNIKQFSGNNPDTEDNNTFDHPPYKHAVGGLLPPTCLGFSYKTFFQENFAFQTDLFYTVTVTGRIENKDIHLALYPTIDINFNLLYENKINEKRNADLFWFIGGGIQAGYAFGNGKVGVNTLLGLEYVFLNKPISLQLDVRPGWSMLFNFDNELKKNFFHPKNNPWSHFDWLIGLTLRYTINEKNNYKQKNR